MPYGVNVHVIGTRKAIRKLRKLPGRVQKKALHRAVSAGAGQIKKAAKPAAPRETGMLQRSFIVKRLKTDAWGDVNYRVQPSSKSKKAIRRTAKGKLVAMGAKKIQAAIASGQKMKYRNPQKYAHLVELGTRRGVSPRHFLKSAYKRSKTAALKAIKARVRKELLMAAKR
jgi:HK97 gp10 family phage protein